MAFDWSTILGGVTGGVLGVIGNVANTLLAMKQQKQEHSFKLAMIPLQLNADVERAKANVAVEQERGAGQAFTASQVADQVTGKESRWVLNVRAMIRPSVLLLLAMGTFGIFTFGEPDVSMKQYIIQNIVTDLSMAIAWYFGARASQQVMQGFQTKAK